MAQRAGLAGREPDLQLLRAALEGTSPRVLLISGEAGIGKSRLLRAGVSAAEGVTTLSGRCLPLTETVPLLPIGDLLRSALDIEGGRWLDEALRAGPAYRREAIEVLVPAVAESGTTPGRLADEAWSRQRLFTAVRDVWASLALSRPAAIVIEDLHWADPSTLDLLDYVICSGLQPPVSIIGTFRLADPDTSQATLSWLARLQRTPGVAMLELEGLSKADTAEQLKMLTGASPEPAVIEQIFARSQGNPLLTEQLAGAGDRSTLPADLRAAVQAKLSLLAEPALQVAQLLAVAARPLSTDQLVTLSDLPLESVHTSLRVLAGWRLIQPTDDELGHRLRHALIGDVITGELRPNESRHLHRRLAESMAAWSGSGVAGEVAVHWRHVGAAADELRWRVKASDEAVEVNAASESAAHLLRAIALWDHVDDQESLVGRPLHDLYLSADDALWSVADLDAERALAEQSLIRLADAAPRVRARLLRGLARARSLADPDAALAAIAQALELLSDAPPSPELVILLAEQAAYHRLQGRYEAYAAAIESALAACQACGDDEWRPRLLIQRAWYQMSTGDLDGALHTIEEDVLSQPLTVREETTAAVFRSDILLKGARYEDVLEATEGTLRRLAELGMTGAVPVIVLRSNAAEALLSLGRTEQAEALVAAGTEGPPTNGTRPVHHLRAEVEIATGRLASALARLTSLLDLASEETEFRVDLIRTWAEAQLWNGNPEIAATDAVGALRVVADREITRLQDWTLVLIARAHADAMETNGLPGQRLSREAELCDLRASLLIDPLAQDTVPATGPACLATWEAELSRLRSAPDPARWNAAAVAWEHLRVPFRAGYCRWREAEAWLGRRGAQGRKAALRALREADAAARGHAPLAAEIMRTAARARLDLSRPGNTGARTPAPTQHVLTERERAVLGLLAEGKTNAEIGAALFISPKTASVHVTNILRKLGVQTRTHAATVAQRAGLLEDA